MLLSLYRTQNIVSSVTMHTNSPGGFLLFHEWMWVTASAGMGVWLWVSNPAGSESCQDLQSSHRVWTHLAQDLLLRPVQSALPGNKG